MGNLIYAFMILVFCVFVHYVATSTIWRKK